jgi:xanthine dehydrogenase accessory factor
MSHDPAAEFGIMLARLERGRPLALATVVATSGSVYRRAGARMLIEPGGESIGSVSGGCLEADLQERALRLATNPAPQVVEYDGLAADGMPWGLGLGCNGRVAVVLQPLQPQDRAWVELLCAARRARRPAALATVFGGAALQPGAVLAVDAQGAVARAAGVSALDGALQSELRGMLAAGRTHIVRQVGAADCSVLLEYLPPAIQLWIIGAGPDAGPLVAAACAQGWNVIVSDHRAAQLTPQRLAGATLQLGEAEATLPRLRVDARTAIVIMTHNYERDRRALAVLAPTAPAYLGVLGPQARTQRLLQELAAAGVRLEAARGALHAPVGLALGAETPEEIAVAIVAEIIARFRGGHGGSLRDRREPIHALD